MSSEQVWEQSKENVQPLRGGRRVAMLENGLQAGHCSMAPSPGPAEKDVSVLGHLSITKSIEDRKSAYEAELRLADTSEDPLEPWHNYIIWLEQTCPRGGKEGNVNSLLEKCIQKFHNVPRYQQDPRYLDVWLKYAAMRSEPRQTFLFMLNNQVGTELSGFYIHYASELESTGNFREAEQIYVKGLSAVKSVEERHVLERKRDLFQARVAKAVMEKCAKNESPVDDDKEEQRTALAPLRGHGKYNKVSSIRVGDAKISEEPGKLKLKGQGPSSNATKPKFNVFLDGMENSQAARQPLSARAGPESLPFQHRTERENELSAGKWSKAKLGKRAHGTHMQEISSKPLFKVHEDENVKQPAVGTSKVQPRVLNTLVSTESEESGTPLALFEPHDPKHRPMYCKDLVYQGTTEVSLEEIRAMKIRKVSKSQHVPNDYIDEKLELLRQEKESLEKQQAEFRKMQENWRLEQERNARLQEEFAQRQREELQKMQRDMLQIQTVVQQQVTTKTDVLSRENKDASEERIKATLVQSPAHPPLQNVSARPSPTLNTKEALHLVRRMWGNTINETNYNAGELEPPHQQGATKFEVFCDPPAKETLTSASFVANDCPPQAAAKLQVFCDSPPKAEESALMVVNTSPPKAASKFEVFCDPLAKETQKSAFLMADSNPPQAASKFEVFCDPPAKDTFKPTLLPASMPQGMLRVEPTEDEKHQDTNGVTTKKHENKENIPPPNYHTHKRPAVGEPLQPANNVRYLPLDVQEAVLDEDEGIGSTEREATVMHGDELLRDQAHEKMQDFPARGRDDRSSQSKENNPNVTMVLPTMEVFTEMAQRYSTPFNGRVPFYNEDDELDENTCAIQIVTRKQSPSENDKAEEPRILSHPDMLSLPAPQQPLLQQGNLPTIMETSREHAYRSSSSSGHSNLSNQISKSHWGNTHLGGQLESKTPGSMLATGTKPTLNTSSCSSGYMADSSSARTPGMVLSKNFASANKSHAMSQAVPREPQKTLSKTSSHRVQTFVAPQDEEDDTGCVSEMMKKLKSDLQTIPGSAARQKSSFLQESLKETHSFLDQTEHRSIGRSMRDDLLMTHNFDQNDSAWLHPGPKSTVDAEWGNTEKAPFQ